MVVVADCIVKTNASTATPLWVMCFALSAPVAVVVGAVSLFVIVAFAMQICHISMGAVTTHYTKYLPLKHI